MLASLVYIVLYQHLLGCNMKAFYCSVIDFLIISILTYGLIYCNNMLCIYILYYLTSVFISYYNVILASGLRAPASAARLMRPGNLKLKNCMHGQSCFMATSQHVHDTIMIMFPIFNLSQFFVAVFMPSSPRKTILVMIV